YRLTNRLYPIVNFCIVAYFYTFDKAAHSQGSIPAYTFSLTLMPNNPLIFCTNSALWSFFSVISNKTTPARYMVAVILPLVSFKLVLLSNPEFLRARASSSSFHSCSFTSASSSIRASYFSPILGKSGNQCSSKYLWISSCSCIQGLISVLEAPL